MSNEVACVIEPRQCSAAAGGVVQAPAYGACGHYLEQKGEEYFAWQGGGGAFGARINARKFESYILPQHTVIDFGCGGGFLLAHLKCNRRIGIEINPVARQHAYSLGVETVSDAAQLPDEIADIVVSDHALEHVPYPIGALQTLRNKLRPKGMIVLCVPIDNWRKQRKYDPKDIHHHLHTWTCQLLGNTLYEAGFELVSIRARVFSWPGEWTVACYNRLPYPVFAAICWLHGQLNGRGGEILAVAKRR